MRYVWELLGGSKKRVNTYEQWGTQTIAPSQVAVLLAAHNEELVIEKTLESLKGIVRADQVYVASDGSKDRTVELVQASGCNVVDIQPNKGKAGALEYALDYFDICKRYKLVLFVDADARVDRDYLDRALPFFTDPKVTAFAGYARSDWPAHRGLKLGGYLVAYRTRLNLILQALFRFGQTWGRVSLSPIIPGFCSLYRTSILGKMEMNPKGLVIEDFNMTFEVHHKKLGRIANYPGVGALDQDPDNYADYFKQIKRWSLGFWQTVRRHGVWVSVFWMALSLFLAELLLSSVFFLSLPVLLVIFGLVYVGAIGGGFLVEGHLSLGLYSVEFADLFFGVILADYIMTLIVAIHQQRPKIALYGLGFIFLRIVDAWIFFYTFVLAFFAKSDGRWKPPTRRKWQDA